MKASKKRRIALIAKGILDFGELNGKPITDADKEAAVKVATIAVSMWDALNAEAP